MSPSASGKPNPALLRALQRLLRPLVQLLIRQQLAYPFLADFLKGIYVEVAEREGPAGGGRQTDSRIHVVTGVHRKDVRRLRHAGPPADPAPRTVSVGAQIVARWTGDKRYLDKNREPLALPMTGSRKQPSFEALVNAISRQDVRPAAVRNELVRLGVCRIDAAQRLVLNQAAFVPDKGFDEKAFYFGQNVGDHLAAAAHNLQGGSPALFERSVYYDRLTPASVDALAKRAGVLAMEALQAINREALALQAADAARADATERMNFGAYFYRERAAPPGESSHA